MTWLYLHFNQIQLNLVQQQADNLVPVIIIDVKKNVIKQCSSNAEELGITKGMGLATALTLANNLTVIEYNQETENNQLTLLANTLYLYSADIALQPPNSLCLKVDSMLKLYDSVTAYWQTITLCLQQFNFDYQHGFASTPLAAELLAKYCNKSATVFCNSKTQEQTQIEALPIHALPFSTSTIQSLSRVGIVTIKQLMAISLKDLAKRFDISVVNTIGQLNGELKAKLTYFKPKTKFTLCLDLLYEATRTDSVLPCLTLILNKLESFLMQRNKVSSEIIINLKQRDHDDLIFTVQSAKGIYKKQDWLKLIELRLERISLQSPILAVELRAEHLMDNHPTINDLFGQPQKGLEDNELISQLQAKLGQHAVCKLHYQNEFFSEFASHTTPVQINEPQSFYQTNTASRVIRPAYLLSKPKRLNEPVQFKLGPERLNTAWWLPNGIQRDYFIVRTKQGQLQWVFKTPSGHWYVQGMFG